MYNNQYEEYMRNSLGYNGMPIMNMNQMNMNQMNTNQMNMNTMNEMYETENTCNQMSVDDMYPEIYKIIYPMVCKACMAVDENVSEDLVSRITNEIYMNVENMECVQETRGSTISVSPQTSKSSKGDSLSSSRTGSSLSSSSSNSSVSSARQQETRQRNPLLRDLIRILVLRELLGNPSRPRPPFRPPYRPPFGGGMGPGQGPRPPFGPQPRSPYEY